jgi:TetR/AcrR family transcriptional repressor of nem operon
MVTWMTKAADRGGASVMGDDVRPTGRPRGFDTGAALDAALEQFWLVGYHETSTRDLEAKLRISQSSIYNAFGSKQGLLEAALERYERRISDALLTPLESATDGPAAIDRFLVSLGRWITTDGRRGCMILNLMAEPVDAPAITGRTRAYQDRLRRAFRSALADGGDDAETEARVEVLLTSVLGVNIAARSGAGAAALQRSIDAVRRLVGGWTTG